ncbi:hypothetical protein PUMCH_002194 [Australozyma saopauloensis]|uniref:Initiator tRNA phosphoribosyl transferase n=1 Tax=Australozyma saopauloensis TaxID=291208 RepID=A0AAX4H8I8_9ASCO|nr:hypothetical protein PUMCH_002194 [[Candida] saopauloensis]
MDYKEILKDLRKESSSVKARLQSILFDNEYVTRFADQCLVANERCGLWYVDPKELTHSAYFKSTDGHTGEWKFSMRRLNFHLLALLGEFRNIVLVDSTRKGKLMPDALLKTVPIWCAVLTYIMYEDDDMEIPNDWNSLKSDNWLLTPPEMVSRSEHAAIAKTIPLHARELKQLGLITKNALIAKLGCKSPILPLWVYPGKPSQSLGYRPNCFTVCCLTTSYRTSPGFVVPDWNYLYPYVQGAGDDHELWASHDLCGGALSPLFFWTKVLTEKEDDSRIIDDDMKIYSWLSEQELKNRLNQIYLDHSKSTSSDSLNLEVTQLGESGLSIGIIKGNVSFDTFRLGAEYSIVIILSEKWRVIDVPQKCSTKVLQFQVESSKKGSKKLREILPQILSNVGELEINERVCIACDSGQDLSVAVALSLLCLQFDLKWLRTTNHQRVNKDIIKQHLALISEHRRVNPSRNSLQSVNASILG